MWGRTIGIAGLGLAAALLAGPAHGQTLTDLGAAMGVHNALAGTGGSSAHAALGSARRKLAIVTPAITAIERLSPETPASPYAPRSKTSGSRGRGARTHWQAGCSAWNDPKSAKSGWIAGKTPTRSWITSKTGANATTSRAWLAGHGQGKVWAQGGTIVKSRSARPKS
jgi:hypothetical protein